MEQMYMCVYFTQIPCPYMDKHNDYGTDYVIYGPLRQIFQYIYLHMHYKINIRFNSH